MHMDGSMQWTHAAAKTEETALELLNLQWEQPPEPCHDYLFFLTRSPDNCRFATASSEFHTDSVTELWDLQDRKLLFRLPTPDTETMYLEWLQNGAFVTGGHDCLLTIRQEDQVVARYYLHRLKGHRHWIKSLAVSGDTLLSGDVGSVLGVWDLPSQRNDRMFVHPNHTEMELNVLMDLAFQHGSEFCFYILQRTGRLSMADLRVKSLLQWTVLLDLPKPSQMKLLENEYQMVISARESQIKLLDLRTSPAVSAQCYSQHTSESLPLGFDFLGYEKYIVSGSDDGFAYIYELCTGRLVKKVRLGNGQVQACCAESVDSLSFFATFNNSRSLGFVDTAGIKPLPHIQSEYQQIAWNSAIAKFSSQLILHIQSLEGSISFNYDRMVSTLRTMQDRASKDMLGQIEAEYQRLLEASGPAASRDFTTNAGEYKGSLRDFIPQEAKRSSVAPKVRREAVQDRYFGDRK